MSVTAPVVNPETPKKTPNRRKFDRKQFDARVAVGNNRYPLVDISEGGVCFLSDRAVPRGEKTSLNPLGLRAVDMKVVRSVPAGEDSTEVYRFKVHCEFAKDLDQNFLKQLVNRLVK